MNKAISTAVHIAARIWERAQILSYKIFQELTVKILEIRQKLPAKYSEGPFIFEWHPNIDIFEKSHEIVIQANLPGISSENVRVELRGNSSIVITGLILPPKEFQTLPYYRNERSYGDFSRRIFLPKDKVDLSEESEVSATLVDGVLEVKVPKLSSDQTQICSWCS